MHYITNVSTQYGVKHIVEVDGRNVEVLHSDKPESYGNKKGEKGYLFNDVTVFDDLTFKYAGSSSSNSVHLAQVVYAIEVVRFIMKKTKGE